MKKFIAIIIAASVVAGAYAQDRRPVTSKLQPRIPSPAAAVRHIAATAEPDELAPVESVSDSLLRVYGSHSDFNPFEVPLTLPPVFFMPMVYDTYHFSRPLTVGENLSSGKEYMRWLEDYEALQRQMNDIRHYIMLNHPDVVRYNLRDLPEAPQQYHAVVNPADFSVSVGEAIPELPAAPTISAEKVRKRHWIRAFNASLQFSQAYVSPNWYQGGNNNLNALANIYYNVKLNQEYHPNLLFETTAQYKLGINNAPDDEVHSYNISEDIFQVNTTFGIKAAHRWYYSFTGQFKTQMVNSYKSNSDELTSSFLSPGELTAGVGMTYNYANSKKTFTFDASLAPVSYHMITCINDKVNASAYGIEEGRSTKHSFGSTAEFKLFWRISYNIRFSSRIFAFTDYESFQADWENTLACDINRFFTTQIYVHARYDTRTPRIAEHEDWHKLQVKEIFSIGFAYKFSSI